jgi:uncharacterized protein
MTATLAPAPPLTRRGGGRRDRLARLERPLLAAGLVLVTIHLLDLALSGPDTALLGVLGIVGAPLAWWLSQPHVTRPTRIALGVVLGLLSVGFGTVSHGLHVVNGAPDLYDLTGVAFILGGLLLVASALTAVAAPRRSPRRSGLGWRAAHGLGWLAGAALVFLFALLPLSMGYMATHAPRWAIQESALGIPHEEVRISSQGRDLSAWYVPSTNGAAVLVGHGSGGSRARVMEEIRMLAANGYGVLALDLAGNGESDGHSNGLGDNAQPAVDAALGYLERRRDVNVERIAAFGSSLGGEVLLEATAGDERIRAVVSDGAARPGDNREVNDPPLLERVLAGIGLQAVRGISGMRPAPSLFESLPRIAPRPVLLIAGGRSPGEVETNRAYRAAAGPTAELYAIPDAGHTSGLAVHPREYEARVVGFLDRAVGTSTAAG